MILLDTDTISVILRDPVGRVARRVARVRETERHTSSVTLGEMLYGLERMPHLVEKRELVENEVVKRLTILPFDIEAARHYARIRARLESEGRPLDDADLRIAAIALAHNLTLVTGNVRHFARVPGLRVENWLE